MTKPLLPKMSRSEAWVLLLACCLRLGMAAFCHPGHPSGVPAVTGSFAVWSGDTFSYLDPVENLFRHGIYAQDIARLDTYAGRMPGYGAVYGLLRLAVGPGPAADGLVVLQLLLSLVSIYCLGRLAQAVIRRRGAFQWAVLLYGASPFIAAFDIRVLTESFAVSALIIGIYTLYRAHRQASNALWLGAGAWLAWAVLLRPFLGPWLGLLAGGYAAWALTARMPTTGRWPHVLRSALLALPFLVADGAWVVRNWPWYHRLMPAQINEWAGYKIAPAMRQATYFVGVIGEEPTCWEPTNDAAWFYRPLNEPAPNFRHEASKLAPPAYTYDSLLLVKRYLLAAQDSTRPAASRQAAEAQAVQAFLRYAQDFRRLRPLRAYGLVPFRLAYWLMLAHPSDYLFWQPFSELTGWEKAVKIAAHLWYLTIVVFGLIGTFCMGWQRRFELLLVKSVPIYLPVLLCFIMFKVEFRYFAVAYPFVVIGAVDFLLKAQKFINRKWGLASQMPGPPILSD